jgi:hypothetical protein
VKSGKTAVFFAAPVPGMPTTHASRAAGSRL